jgi:putative proteasome-type protease
MAFSGRKTLTYCIGIGVQDGLVFVSDSRTNAGVDQISTYSKMRAYGVPGERQFMICSAGNLATTQGVIAHIERDLRDGAAVNLLTVPNVSEAASYVGELSREQQAKTGGGHVFEASFLVGGEIAGGNCRLMLVYAEGNHIASSRQTPYLQIGESKYGKPMLDRIIAIDTPLERAALCALISMDATMRSNVTVGPPIELNVYTAGSLQPGRNTSFGEDSAYLRRLKKHWDRAVHDAFDRLPAIDWNGTDDA